RYDLTERVSDTSKNNSIETFFVERAAQLLKPCGIAGIILPASILSNGDGVYTRCREIILENFDIIAIAEFASGTFEMTGTNTITLFLRKKDAPPDFADHWRNRVKAWFESKHDGDEVFNDADALERYCAKRGFDLEEYKLFLGRTLPPSSELWNTSAFKAYRETFAKKNAKKKGTDVQDFIRAQERDRLYYFLLADSNPVPVLLVKMPTETKAAKAFLGYEWSRAKGNEGIKYLGSATSTTAEEDTLSRNRGIKSINTPLFDNSRLDNEDAPKLNSLIRKNFRGILTDIPEELKPFTRRVLLTDMLDFDAAIFDKQIKTSAAEKVEVRSKFSLVRLGDLCVLQSGQDLTPDKYNDSHNGIPYITGASNFVDDGIKIDRWTASPTNIAHKGDLLLTCKGTVGRLAFLEVAKAHIARQVMGIKVNDLCDSSFLRNVLEFETKQLAKDANGMIPGVNRTQVLSLTIPLPPPDIQKAVAVECALVDADYARAKKTIEDGRSHIENIFADLGSKLSAASGYKRLGDVCAPPMYGASVSAKDGDPQTDYRYIRITDIDDYGNLNDDWKTAEKIDEKYILQDGDVLFARSGATAGKTFLYKSEIGKAIYAGYLIKFAPRRDTLLPEFLIAFTHSASYLEWAKNIRGGTAQPNINAQQYSNLLVPVPSLDEQKKIVAAVEAIEAKIAEAKATMADCPTRKREILRKHGVLL
ncbi:MAG: restriction endonuclease subunit S, partial [Thermoguttaceae bacterium]